MVKRSDCGAMVASRTVGDRDEVDAREDVEEMVEKREGGGGGYVVGGEKVEVEMEEKVAVEGEVSVGVGGGSPRSKSTRHETMTSISTPPPSSSGSCMQRREKCIVRTDTILIKLSDSCYSQGLPARPGEGSTSSSGTGATRWRARSASTAS